MYPTKLDGLDKNIAKRIRIERRIVRSLLSEFAAQGFTFRVDDGEDIHHCATPAKAIDALMNTDEDKLYMLKDGKSIGGIYLVYGNEGWSVMSDWTTTLDQYMPKTLALVEKLSN